MSKLAKYALNKAREKATKKWSENPPLKTDIMTYVVPGAVAFVATNIAMNLGQTALSKNLSTPWLRLGVGVGVGAGLYAAGTYLKFAKKWHQPMIIGAGIALAMEAVKRLAPTMAPAVGLPALASYEQTAMGEYADLADDYRTPVRRSTALTPVPSAAKTAQATEEILQDKDIPTEWSGAWGAVEGSDGLDDEAN